MHNKFLAIIALLVLSGCSTFGKPPVIIEKPTFIRVEVPIVQPCVSEEVPLPELLIGKLTDEDQKDPGKVVQFYVADVTALKGVVLRQRKLLNACKIQPDGAAPVEPEVKPLAPASVIEEHVLPPEPAVPVVKDPTIKTFDPPPPPR